MRLANSGGLSLLVDDAGRAADLATASGGRFASDPMEALAGWDAVRAWAAGARVAFGDPLEPRAPGPCAPRPAAAVAIGPNYREHAPEAQRAPPNAPTVLTDAAGGLCGAAHGTQ